jgi:hypothetical protein
MVIVDICCLVFVVFFEKGTGRQSLQMIAPNSREIFGWLVILW